ncbi:MAG TPA: hypothetical protein VFQ53_11805 [Kofleriaceae bacterium]|nr:hypothetical protein [Kofleriaceae bacterium]
MARLAPFLVVLVACTKAAPDEPPAPAPAPAPAIAKRATPCAPDPQAADVPLGRKAIAIAAAGERACAILDDRSVACWGNDEVEHDPDFTARASGPEPVRGLADVVELALSEHSGCARHASGAIDCWSMPPRTAIPVKAPPSKITTAGTLGLGLAYACMVRDRAVWCGGELVPFGRFGAWTRVAGSDGATQVATGGDTGCAITGGGRVACWGGRFQRHDTPIRAQHVHALDGAQQLAVSGWDSCALARDGGITCLRQAEDDIVVPIRVQHRAAALEALHDGKRFALDDRDGCVVRADGHVACWQGSSGTASARDPAIAVDVPGITNAIDVAMGGGFACVLRADGGVRCWGFNDHHELGIDTLLHSATPLPVCGLERVTQVATGGQHVCALRDDGDVYCWGANHDGQLGDGTTTHSARPVRATAGAGAGATTSTIGEVVAYEQSTCTRDRAGRVACWGRNPRWGLTDPTFVVPASPVRQIALGTSGLCAITPERTVTCNGAVVPGVTHAKQLRARDLTCAEVEAAPGSRVLCWGARFESLLPRAPHQPYRDPGLLEAVRCGTGTCGRAANGELFCANASAADPAHCTPWPIDQLDTLVAPPPPTRTTCTLQAGLVQCVGDNRFGQLGTGKLGYLAHP